MLRGQPEDRQRQADLVVLVALALEGRHRGGEDGGRGVLRGGLGHAAGDPHHDRREAGPPGGRDGVQAGQRVGDPDDRDVAEGVEGGLAEGLGHEERGRLAEKAVAVGPLARQSDEEGTWDHQTRVNGGVGDHLTRTRHLLARQGLEHMTQRQHRL